MTEQHLLTRRVAIGHAHALMTDVITRDHPRDSCPMTDVITRDHTHDHRDAHHNADRVGGRALGVGVGVGVTVVGRGAPVPSSQTDFPPLPRPQHLDSIEPSGGLRPRTTCTSGQRATGASLPTREPPDAAFRFSRRFNLLIPLDDRGKPSSHSPAFSPRARRSFLLLALTAPLHRLRHGCQSQHADNTSQDGGCSRPTTGGTASSSGQSASGMSSGFATSSGGSTMDAGGHGTRCDDAGNCSCIAVASIGHEGVWGLQQ